MYSYLLTIHSWFRWIVFAAILIAILDAYRGWKLNSIYTTWDNRIRHWSATIAHIQLMIGLWLYFISPIVHYFLHNLSDGIHHREIRFFGLEHSSMMLVGITILSIGSAKAKRKSTNRDKFKTQAIWYSIALIIILANIPWSFSPLISRPNFRMF